MQLAALVGGAAVSVVMAAGVTGCGGTGAVPARTAPVKPPRGDAIIAAGEEESTVRLRRWHLGGRLARAPFPAPVSTFPGPVRVDADTLSFGQGQKLSTVGLRGGFPRRLDIPGGAAPFVIAPGGTSLAAAAGRCVPPSDPAATLRLFRLSPRVRDLRIKPRFVADSDLVTLVPEAWSGDGNRLVFTIWRDWANEDDCARAGSHLSTVLYVLDLRTGSTRKLDSGFYITDVSVDPSGRWVAYALEGDLLDKDVRVASLVSRQTRVLAHGNDVRAGPLAWSPAAPALVYVFDASIRSYVPSSRRKVTLGRVDEPDTDPMIAGFSRDGRRVAYVSLPVSSSALPILLHAVALDGSRRSKLRVPTPSPLQTLYGVWVDLD